jgi:hypothetical protein
MKIILGGNGLPVQVNDVVKIVHHVLQIGGDESHRVLKVIANNIFYIEPCNFCNTSFTGGLLKIVSLHGIDDDKSGSFKGIA